MSCLGYILVLFCLFMMVGFYLFFVTNQCEILYLNKDYTLYWTIIIFGSIVMFNLFFNYLHAVFLNPGKITEKISNMQEEINI